MEKILGLVLIIVSCNSYAGSASSGSLRQVHFMNNGVVIMYTNGARSNVPVCATSQPSRFAINATTSGGKVQLTGILSAHATGKNIVIIGAGNCSVQGDTETINYFYTAD